MKWNVERAVVLGAGTMGAQIAAHLANCGIPTSLLDLVPDHLTPEEKKKGLSLSSPLVRNRLARAGIETARTSKPPAFFLQEKTSWITPGNFEDNLSWVAEADWIIEAVSENLEAKRGLLERVLAFRKPGTVVSSNTSGLPVGRIAAGFPEEFRRHWLGVHFFNPPRYLHLCELIPGPDTLPEIVEAVAGFADLRLGKGVVRAKDTPNFIANRIGTFFACNIFRIMSEENFTLEEVDQLTGPALGWPKTATFGTLDLVGLDILASVTRNLLENVPEDESRELFRLPAFMEKMLSQGLLGAKTGAGFYKRVKQASGSSDALVIDPETLEYRPQKKSQFASLETGKGIGKGIQDTRERVGMLAGSDDRAGRFLWKVLSRTFLYAARRIPEITDRIVEIDRAMRWGFGWKLGPFELWDAVGLEGSLRRMEGEGCQAPENIRQMLSSGRKRFYQNAEHGLLYFDFGRGNYRLIEQPPGVLPLGGQGSHPVIEKNDDASLLDLGDGVACVEFHSKGNAIGAGTIAMVESGLRELSANFDALVIANQGTNFSAGANLQLLLEEIRAEHWEALDRMLRSFQQMNMAIKYSPKPVVVAPFRFTLGGGCEMAFAASRVQASAETYMGLVETGVGLLPGAGGTKEMALRAADSLPAGSELLPSIREAFQTITNAKVSGSAEEARQLRFLGPADGITLNPDRLAADAKQAALEMARNNWKRAHPAPRTDVRVLGEGGLAELKISVHLFRSGGFISDHDALIAGKIACVLCGGKLTGPAAVSEQYLLDLEREASLSLYGEPKTQARIEHMLRTGKPLRN
ncbi:MAG: enoyl-CoA hydratase/isomerase family protein [Acidobacteria bacterium]|nr:enoyl-CoA hydratase/isomerase family protein [Acidobacteriota bacterium]